MNKFTSLEKVGLAAESALDKKGENIALLDMREVSTLCDWFLLVSANSSRRIDTILKAIDDRLSEIDIEPLSREGKDNPYWSLLDYGDFIVHIFQAHVREFYSLERLWSDAPKTQINEKWLRETLPKI